MPLAKPCLTKQFFFTSASRTRAAQGMSLPMSLCASPQELLQSHLYQWLYLGILKLAMVGIFTPQENWQADQVSFGEPGHSSMSISQAAWSESLWWWLLMYPIKNGHSLRNSWMLASRTLCNTDCKQASMQRDYKWKNWCSDLSGQRLHHEDPNFLGVMSL